MSSNSDEDISKMRELQYLQLLWEIGVIYKLLPLEIFFGESGKD